MLARTCLTVACLIYCHFRSALTYFISAFDYPYYVSHIHPSRSAVGGLWNFFVILVTFREQLEYVSSGTGVIQSGAKLRKDE